MGIYIGQLPVPLKIIHDIQSEASAFEKLDWMDAFDLEKSWGGMYYILCEEGRRMDPPPWPESPCGRAIFGSHDLIPDQEPMIRWNGPDEIAAISEALGADSFNKSVFDPEDMNRKFVYPASWTRDPERWLEYLTGQYARLRSFYRQCAADGHALIVSIG